MGQMSNAWSKSVKEQAVFRLYELYPELSPFLF